MIVSELAGKLGISSDTVRHYTRIGLLHPEQGENSYNHYSADDERRLKFTLNARRLGFSLKDISDLLELADRGEAPCPMAREVIDRNLERLGQSIEESLVLYRRMQAAAKAWKELPDDPPDGRHICDLIEGDHECNLAAMPKSDLYGEVQHG